MNGSWYRKNRVIDVPGSAHSNQDVETDFEGTRRRRITRSIENMRATRINMEKEGLSRPVSRRDTWDLLVWGGPAHLACVKLRACLTRRKICPNARMNS